MGFLKRWKTKVVSVLEEEVSSKAVSVHILLIALNLMVAWLAARYIYSEPRVSSVFFFIYMVTTIMILIALDRELESDKRREDNDKSN